MNDVLVCRKKAASQLAFCLIFESQPVEPTTLDFLAPDELVFDYWTDGINALLGKQFALC